MKNVDNEKMPTLWEIVANPKLSENRNFVLSSSKSGKKY